MALVPERVIGSALFMAHAKEGTRTYHFASLRRCFAAVCFRQTQITNALRAYNGNAPYAEISWRVPSLRNCFRD